MRSVTRPAGTTAPSSTSACQSSSPPWPSRAAMAAMRASWPSSAASISSSWMIGAWSPSMPGPGTICSKSSRSATGGAPPSSPANSLRQAGMPSWPIPPTPTPSWTVCFTTPTGSTSTATACDAEKRRRRLDAPPQSIAQKNKPLRPRRQGARSSRTPGAPSNRNQGAKSSESAPLMASAVIEEKHGTGAGVAPSSRCSLPQLYRACQWNPRAARSPSPVMREA